MLDRFLQWWAFFKLGGPVMYPLFLCSVTAMAIIFERLWMLRQTRVMPRGTIQETKSLLSSGDLVKARALLSASDTPIARILIAGLDRVDKGREVIREAMEDAGRGEIHRLSQFINMLGGVAGVSTLLGFLGTVVGMIKAFNVIVERGVTTPADVAGGVSMAMITTAAGLVIAVPAFIANRYFAGKVDNYAAEMEEIAASCVESMLDAHAGRKNSEGAG